MRSLMREKKPHDGYTALLDFLTAHHTNYFVMTSTACGPPPTAPPDAHHVPGPRRLNPGHSGPSQATSTATLGRADMTSSDCLSLTAVSNGCRQVSGREPPAFQPAAFGGCDPRPACLRTTGSAPLWERTATVAPQSGPARRPCPHHRSPSSNAPCRPPMQRPLPKGPGTLCGPERSTARPAVRPAARTSPTARIRTTRSSGAEKASSSDGCGSGLTRV